VAANGSGDWTGQDGSIAVYENAAWAFYAHQNGWQAVVRAEGTTLIFNGLDWVGSAIDALALQNVNGVGINTTADDVNRLAVSADATLLSHNGSDHRVVVNKDAPTDTASLLFQTGYSGRAEMGTAGGDDFSIKVSNDSMSWNTALTLDGATGRPVRRLRAALILVVAFIVTRTIVGLPTTRLSASKPKTCSAMAETAQSLRYHGKICRPWYPKKAASQR
jgi:hypothetical protein